MPPPVPNAPVFGTLGLGSTSLSRIAKDANDGSLSIADQLMIQKGGNPYITLLIAPFESDKGQPSSFSGAMSVGTPVDLPKIFSVPKEKLAAVGVPDLSKVTQQPKVPFGSGNTFPIDSVQVNGQAVNVQSFDRDTVPGRLTARLSTKYPYIVAPRAVVDALYAKVPGASFSESDGLYRVPCTTQLAATLTISDVQIPLSPLDLVSTQLATNECVGSVRYIAAICSIIN